ncbi:MAG: hypothetical protein R3C18_16670 [Planctomycetaceae bacterium]
MDFQVVFERELHITQGDTERVGVLRISCDNDTAAGFCRCMFSIPVIQEQMRPSYGDDMLQALVLALRSIRSQIEGAEERGIVIWWAEPGDRGAL